MYLYSTPPPWQNLAPFLSGTVLLYSLYHNSTYAHLPHHSLLYHKPHISIKQDNSGRCYAKSLLTVTDPETSEKGKKHEI